MSTQQTLAAARRAGGEVNKAWSVYRMTTDPAELKKARRKLDAAMDAYERALEKHVAALTKQIKAMADDPRHVRPPRGDTKGL